MVLGAGESSFATTRDGRRLHVVAAGSGAPTVVFESGMGSARHAWDLVVPAIARETRAVVYDRSGYGGSPRDPEPRTLARAAGDLQDLLHHLGDGPFVLVGHSWGGLIVRCVAFLERARVRGLVLVDASDEGCALYFDEAMVRRQSFFARALPLAARTGLLRFGARRIVKVLPRDLADAIVAESATLDAARTMQSELVPFVGDLRELRDASPKDPDVPMTVISGTLRPRFGAAIRDSIVEAHARRAALQPRGRHVRAERSGHYVMLTEPDLVAREILDVVASVRSAPTR